MRRKLGGNRLMGGNREEEVKESIKDKRRRSR